MKAIKSIIYNIYNIIALQVVSQNVQPGKDTAMIYP